ncbi:RELT-like protein 2 isoform X3 [Cyclopterus lumpus]|nr:RELT-like protein 2 isoform X3 [Cyclopterus lumpus]XP_034399044.1 RELT-like protein 2 isoform X3 [Cyclopterus lumpus]XP_034399045.1 RELT-like protein 2 isoform X3 [Cyclopterus lumpus]
MQLAPKQSRLITDQTYIMTELEASGVVDHPPPYIIFVVVFLFFLTGLLGFLVCHLLKKKGYRCRTGDMDDEKEEEKLGGNADDEDEENQDTVEQILKCIIENEANMEAFNEMFGNHAQHDPRLRKESVGGVPPHHHTVHSGSAHNSCHLCAQVRSKKGRRQSRPPRFKQRPGEQTVFSVGRFRVTHTDKKLHGGPNPLVNSGDQLDQSQDSEEPKEGGYNLRSMFKDVQSPSEGSTVNVGKRRKSVTIFGLRRGSDPVGIKVKEGTGRETGGIRFAIQQQPVVLEELLQAENIEVANGSDTKPGIKPETKPSKSQTLASPQHVPNILGSVNSPSYQSKDLVHALKDGSKHRPSAEPGTNHMFKLSIGTSVASAPSSLPIPSPALSEHSFKTTEKQGNVVEDKVLKKEEAYDPGPLQTSTPIAPIPVSIPGFTPVIPIGQPEPCSSPGCSVTETPRDPSFSTDLESGFGASLALISLGSSPPSLLPIKTPSSSSSLKMPISLVGVTPSPKLSSRNTPSEAGKTAFSSSPKLPSGTAMSSQAPVLSSSFRKSTSPLQAPILLPALTASSKLDTMPVSPQTPSSSTADHNLSFRSSPRLTLKSGSVVSVASMTRGDMISLKEQELEVARTLKTEEKTEITRVGILKTVILSPVEGHSKGSALYSPTENRLSSLPLSPSSPLSLSSPIGSRINSVTIIKASPDSKREFSVVTLMEQEVSSTSIKQQKGATSELRVESEKGDEICVSGVGHRESQNEETPRAEVKPRVSQEKDDMVEMEDIRDCKVTQVEEEERVEEELEKMVTI